MGKPAHVPTDKTRAEVSALTSFGITQDEISTYLDIDLKTLRKHYRRELDTGTTRANAAMAKRLFDAGVKDGSVPAMIFWLKTRARWRETDDSNNGEDERQSHQGLTIVIKRDSRDNKSSQTDDIDE